MKARLPSKFQLFASQFNLESILCSVSSISCSILMSEGSLLWKKQHYRYYNQGDEVILLQTWLIDLIYDLCCLGKSGSRIITKEETYHLINLYNIEKNQRPPIKNEDLLLFIFGLMGEQIGIQTQKKLFETYARESYILEEIFKTTIDYSIDFSGTLKTVTGFDPFEYSLLFLSLWTYFVKNEGAVLRNGISVLNEKLIINSKNLYHIIDQHSETIDGIQKSNLKRQVFYTKPFIKTQNGYVLSNSYIILYAFAHANYWVLRNYYLQKKSQDFINAFGIYFELYFEEILSNCLDSSEYKRISTDTKKRADWLLKLFNQDILIEQKSALAFLDIKQNQPNIDAIKTFITQKWGKAVNQLYETEKDLELNEPIMIILVYEDYFPCEILDEIFRLDDSLIDDHRYWLVTIDEMERFLSLYKNNTHMAKEVFLAKKTAELTKDPKGRSLEKFLETKGLTENDYLRQFGIFYKFERLTKRISGGNNDKTNEGQRG